MVEPASHGILGIPREKQPMPRTRGGKLVAGIEPGPYRIQFARTGVRKGWAVSGDSRGLTHAAGRGLFVASQIAAKAEGYPTAKALKMRAKAAKAAARKR